MRQLEHVGPQVHAGRQKGGLRRRLDVTGEQHAAPGDLDPYHQAPVAIVACNDGDTGGVCIDAMPLVDKRDAMQMIYADLAVCGTPAASLRAFGQTQQSLTSEPLRAVIGAVPCNANNQCASDLCVDGVCCDAECGGGAPNDCLA